MLRRDCPSRNAMAMETVYTRLHREAEYDLPMQGARGEHHTRPARPDGEARGVAIQAGMVNRLAGLFDLARMVYLSGTMAQSATR